MNQVPISDAFNKFKPESCVFVISYDNANNRPSGMVAGWNMHCSGEPPLLAVSLSKKGHTHKLILDAKEFVIAVPSKDVEKDVVFFGSHHGNEIDKFKESGIKTKQAKELNLPLIEDAAINFECKLEKEVDSGDHIMFIGKVIAAHINKDKKILLNLGRDKDNNRIFSEFT